MDLLLKNICDLFLQNKYNCNGYYTIGASELDDLVAYIFTLNDQRMDHEVMLQQYRYLYRKEIDASYRDYARIPLMCYMAMSEDSEAYFEQVEAIHDQIPSLGLCNYEVDAAIMIQNSRPDDATSVIERSYAMYNRLKKEHPINTTKLDFPLACIVALSDRSVDDLMNDYEECYKAIKPLIGEGAYYHKLALNTIWGDGQPIEKCQKVLAIRKMLEKKKRSLGQDFRATALNLFASRPESAEAIVDLIIDVDDYIKPQKGFHGFFNSSEHRRLVAALLVHKYLMDKTRVDRELSLEERITYSLAVHKAQRIIFTDGGMSTP